MLSQTLGTEHHIIHCKPQFMVDYFDRIVSFYGELFADESMIPTTCLSMHAKQKVDVVLTGDGADELFHGYGRYFFDGVEELYDDIFSAIPLKTRKMICHPNFLAIAPTPLLSYEKE